MVEAVIFHHQLRHQRFISGAIGRSRRSWTKHYSWLSAEQQKTYTEVDRIYKEHYDKYGDDIYNELAQKLRLNKRLWFNPPTSADLSKVNSTKLSSIKNDCQAKRRDVLTATIDKADISQVPKHSIDPNELTPISVDTATRKNPQILCYKHCYN